MPHNALPRRLVDPPRNKLPVALERRHDVELVPARHLVVMTSPNGPAVNHHRRAVQPSHRDHAAGHVLIAPGDRDHPVIPLAAHHRLNRIGNQIARLQRETHPLRAHRDAVADPHRVETKADQTCRLHALLHLRRKIQQMHVAGIAFIPDTGDPDFRLLHVAFDKARGIKHGLRSPLRGRLRNT